MPCCYSRRFVLRLGVFGLLSAGSPGCGTILYPERIGQLRGPLDWKVVGLNTIGLLLFVVPGAIAFAVDFYNGTIYLPESSYNYSDAKGRGEARRLVSIPVSREELSQDNIERIVSTHANRKVRLVEGDYQTQELESIDQFWNTLAACP